MILWKNNFEFLFLWFLIFSNSFFLQIFHPLIKNPSKKFQENEIQRSERANERKQYKIINQKGTDAIEFSFEIFTC